MKGERVYGVRSRVQGVCLRIRVLGLGVQGYLAYKKTPTPPGPPRSLGIGLRKGPRGVRFRVSEVPL